MLPGDYAVTSIAGATGKLISLGERLSGDGFTQYDHALIYIGGMQIVEAEPGGARCRTIDNANAGYELAEWSALDLNVAERHRICVAARGYIGTPYSVADYFALAAHHLHVPAPGLRSRIASTGHMICSQLVDQCYQDAGVHLFADGRWPGYVMPSDLAGLIG